jgi:GT2 family glycosyltransferase
MVEMRFLLITATDGSTESRVHLRSLMQSLGTQDERCDLVLVLRGPAAVSVSTVPMNVTIHPVTAPLATTLSGARNLALTRARTDGLLAGCGAVAFPDDDCAYPPRTLHRVAEHLRGRIEMVCAVYAPGPRAVDWTRFPPSPQDVEIDLVMRSQSSNTMFLTTRLVASLGAFDERFGLGARFGSAEDADYMIRVLATGARATYDPRVLVLHPYKSDRHETYFEGNVAVLAKHAFGEGRTLDALLRRLAVGLMLLGCRRLRASTYVAALRAAAVMLPVGVSFPRRGRRGASLTSRQPENTAPRAPVRSSRRCSA